MNAARPLALAIALAALPVLIGQGCSASNENPDPGAGASSSGGGSGGGTGECDVCFLNTYTPCNPDGTPGASIQCEHACADGLGCVACEPGSTDCVGNEVFRCIEDGSGYTEYVETCDVSLGFVCDEGVCKTGCEIAADQPSNVGCEFWAVDLDQVDFPPNNPANAPWGVALANAGQTTANVTIEINEAAPGEPLNLVAIEQLSVDPGTLISTVLPTRELDCGLQPNDYAAPGTCLSSRAFRITSSSPIVVYQYNVFENAYSNDASLLLPTNALGQIYRVVGWPAGHPIYIAALGVIDRSYITIVGTEENTEVTVTPTFRIRGNPPIDATAAGGTITATLGPFDVLNLETDDGTLQDDQSTITDLSASIVTATRPVAVFTGVETTSAPGGVVDIPTYPGWDSDSTCCLDHLEEQMFPVESVGSRYVITRSPIRSSGSYHEPDVIRFLGVAEQAVITSTLPAPYDSFTLNPGDVVTTYAQQDFVASSDKPFMVAQILISQGYVDGPYTGDPAMTVFPPVEQFRTEYVILTPPSWTTNWVVIAAPVDAEVTIDGAVPSNCIVTPAGASEGVPYESRRCPLDEGVHPLSGSEPFGIIAYGYGAAGSYAFTGGADVEHIYDPPPLR